MNCKSLFLFCFAVISLVMLPLTEALYCYPGELDRTFGPGGLLMMSFSSGEDSVEDMILQPDGKIVAVGKIGHFPSLSVVGGGVARFNSNGTIDNQFGYNGRSLLTITGFSIWVNGVALQGDGKIVVCGGITDIHGNGTVLLARYSVNGEIDQTFGDRGRVLTQIGLNSNAIDVAIQPNGKIVIVGTSNRDFLIGRYNSDGTQDTSFGSGGVVLTSFSPDGDIAFDVELLSDERILVAGYSESGSQRQIAVARYLSTGDLDTSFDGDGKVTTSFGPGTSIGFDSAIHTDGKIVVGGYYTLDSTMTVPALARFNSNGSLDTTFGSGGKVTIQGGTLGGVFYSITIDSNGKIIAVGSARDLIRPNNQDFLISRFNVSGSLDQTFGNSYDGRVRIGVSRYFENDEAYAVAIQPDQKIVVGGTSPRHYRRSFDFAFVRLLGN